MKNKTTFCLATAFAAATMLLGCGGDEEATAPTIEPIDVSQEAAKPNNSRTKSTKRTAKSAIDRIDDALDNDNYMAAVDIAIKSGKTADENMSNLRYVQEELGDPMANGDTKAHEAYKKLNTFYIIQHQR